jgi:hypothetical protein
MRKKSDAQIHLERVERIDTVIKNKLIERDQWRDVALGITACAESVMVERNGRRELHKMEKVQSSARPSKMADAIDKVVDMEAEINALIDRLIDTKREVVHIIERVDSPVEYDLLHRRYIQYQSLQEIADHYRKEYTWATTTHGRALKSVEMILKGGGNDA